MQDWSSLIAVAFWATIITLCVKGKIKMRWFAFTFLLLGSFQAFMIGYANVYGAPSDFIIIGDNIPYIPFTVALLILLLAFLSLRFGKKNSEHTNIKPSPLRWIWLIVGILLQTISLWFLVYTIFGYQMLGSDMPLPNIGVMTYLLMSIVVAFLLYFTSKMNTSKYPNLFRWIILFYSVFAIGQLTVVPLMLIYSVSIEPPVAFPFWSNIAAIGYIPYSVLMVVLTKDNVQVVRAREKIT